MKKEKGITLISLIITIIILLILVGVAISIIGGENGLISKTNLSKKRYEISEAKEKLELEITNLRIEQEGKGYSLTKEDLPKINSDEIDVKNTDNFPVEVICGKYKFNVDENFNVTYVGEADGTIITYTTEPEGYTNQDEIQILIKVSNPKGIKTIEYPDGDKLEVGGATERGIDYTVTANGAYTFKVIDIDNNEVIKDIVIEQIDKLEPLDLTITISDIEINKFTVTVDAQDAESDGTSTKSGIAKFEYYVRNSTVSQYTKYETIEGKFTFTELEPATEYSMYVIAYDYAGNSKASTEEVVETLDNVLEYPLLTLNGVCNYKNVRDDGTIEYLYDPNITIDNISAVGPSAYDRDLNTVYSTNQNYYRYVEIAEEMEGKKIQIKVNMTYVTEIYFFDEEGNVLNCDYTDSTGEYLNQNSYSTWHVNSSWDINGILVSPVFKIPMGARKLGFIRGGFSSDIYYSIYEIQLVE